MIRYDYESIQEYIDRYIDIMILYTYFKEHLYLYYLTNATKNI